MSILTCPCRCSLQLPAPAWMPEASSWVSAPCMLARVCVRVCVCASRRAHTCTAACAGSQQYGHMHMCVPCICSLGCPAQPRRASHVRTNAAGSSAATPLTCYHQHTHAPASMLSAADGLGHGRAFCLSHPLPPLLGFAQASPAAAPPSTPWCKTCAKPPSCYDG